MKTGIIIFLGILLIVAFIWLLRRYIVYLVDKSISDYQSELLYKHCEEVENMYRQVRGWRHDYHNHIQTMKAHLALGNLDELESYLDELDTDLSTVDTVIKTGNVMMDAVLNSKISLARSKHIAVDAKAIVPKKLNLSEVDLSLIIGNLLDNAMEACEKIPNSDERFIRVYIDILKGQLYIYVINSMQGNPQRVGNGYVSTKTGNSHGFGLMRIDKVVERYHGYLERQNEEGVFATEVMLPL